MGRNAWNLALGCFVGGRPGPPWTSRPLTGPRFALTVCPPPRPPQRNAPGGPRGAPAAAFVEITLISVVPFGKISQHARGVGPTKTDPSPGSSLPFVVIVCPRVLNTILEAARTAGQRRPPPAAAGTEGQRGRRGSGDGAGLAARRPAAPLLSLSPPPSFFFFFDRSLPCSHSKSLESAAKACPPCTLFSCQRRPSELQEKVYSGGRSHKAPARRGRCAQRPPRLSPRPRL